jgi:hypothetical protein
LDHRNQVDAGRDRQEGQAPVGKRRRRWRGKRRRGKKKIKIKIRIKKKKKIERVP